MCNSLNILTQQRGPIISQGWGGGPVACRRRHSLHHPLNWDCRRWRGPAGLMRPTGLPYLNPQFPIFIIMLVPVKIFPVPKSLGLARGWYWYNCWMEFCSLNYQCIWWWWLLLIITWKLYVLIYGMNYFKNSELGPKLLLRLINGSLRNKPKWYMQSACQSYNIYTYN